MMLRYLLLLISVVMLFGEARAVCTLTAPTGGTITGAASNACTATLANGVSCTPKCTATHYELDPNNNQYTCAAGTDTLSATPICKPKFCTLTAPTGGSITGAATDPCSATLGGASILANGASCKPKCNENWEIHPDNTQYTCAATGTALSATPVCRAKSTGWVNTVPSNKAGYHVHDFDSCDTRAWDTANAFDAQWHDFSKVTASAELWDDFPAQVNPTASQDGSTAADYSGFVTGTTGDFQLTIAVPVIYQAQKTIIEFVRATQHGPCVSTVQPCLSANMESSGSSAASTDTGPANNPYDHWTVTTCQQWPSDDSSLWATTAHDGVMDRTVCTEDQYADCYAVFKYQDSWKDFTESLGICTPAAGKTQCTTLHALSRIEYASYSTTGPQRPKASSSKTSKQPDLPAQNTPTAQGDDKYIEFCGEVYVQMKEKFDDVGPYTLDVTRNVKDRFVFCLVFQTRVEVTSEIKIYDEPDFFQLLRVQEAAVLQPDDVNCPAKFQINILTLVQSPFALENFEAYLNVAQTPLSGSIYTPMAMWPADHGGATPTAAQSALRGKPRYLPVTVNAANSPTTPSRHGSQFHCNGMLGTTALAADSTADCQQDWALRYCVDECEADGNIGLSFRVVCRTAWATVDIVDPIGTPDNECPLPGYTHTHCSATCTTAQNANAGACDCTVGTASGNWAAATSAECLNAYGSCAGPTNAATGALNVDAVRRVTGTITLDSASYCAMLIEAVDVTGSMLSYDDRRLHLAAFRRDDFVTGATACFKGSFKATTESGADNTKAPAICGISVLRINLDSTTTTNTGNTGTSLPVTVFDQDIWTGPAWSSSHEAPYTYTQRISTSHLTRARMCGVDDAGEAVGPNPLSTTHCTYGTYGGGIDVNDLALDIFDITKTTSVALVTDGTALSATGGTAVATARTSNIGFCYKLDKTILAPAEHESYTLTTSALVEVVFCDTSTTKLMAVAFPYKKDAYERAGLLQLQDGPANLNEIEATVGMFDPLPADPADTGVLPDDTPADDQLPGVIEKKDEELAVNTGGGMEIWPIVAGVVGAITVCIIVLLIALRRHRNGQKQKTVAVIPNTKGYGKVAVVTVKNGSGALP